MNAKKMLAPLHRPGLLGEGRRPDEVDTTRTSEQDRCRQF